MAQSGFLRWLLNPTSTREAHRPSVQYRLLLHGRDRGAVLTHGLPHPRLLTHSQRDGSCCVTSVLLRQAPTQDERTVGSTLSGSSQSLP